MVFDQEEQQKQLAREEFARNHHKGTWQQRWSRLIGTQAELADLARVRRCARTAVQSDAGLQTVPIHAIVGSEGRSNEFDRQWRPLTDTYRERWVNIAAEHVKGTGLPAVDLVRVGDHYFVRDGHHRISVAKAYGQLEIEANVVDWHLEPVARSTPNYSGQQLTKKEKMMLYYDLNEVRQMDRDRRIQLQRSYASALADTVFLKTAAGKLMDRLGHLFLGWGRRLQSDGRLQEVFVRNTSTRSGAGL